MNSPVTLHREARSRFIAVVATALIGIAPCISSAADAGLLQWSFPYYNAQVPVAIWYPTSGETSEIDAGPFTLRATGDGETEQRQHALLVISHGTGGSNIAHHPIAEALASAGFMVAALTHPGDNFQDRSLIADERYFDERPRQLHALLAALTTDENFTSLIDTTRIGAIGHSAGGYAVAAAIGARPDRQALIDHCSLVSDDPSCNYRDPSIGVVMPTSNPFTLPTEIDSPEQPATLIRAAVLLAPLGSVISSASHIDKTIPLKIITAENDTVLPQQYHLSRLQQVAPHAESRIAAGAGHYSFIAPVNTSWRSQLAEVAEDPAGFDRAEFNRQLGFELSEWFLKILNPS